MVQNRNRSNENHNMYIYDTTDMCDIRILQPIASRGDDICPTSAPSPQFTVHFSGTFNARAYQRFQKDYTARYRRRMLDGDALSRSKDHPIAHLRTVGPPPSADAQQVTIPKSSRWLPAAEQNHCGDKWGNGV